jgi:ABC-type branched-subunit amino acid transport system ATPase component
MVRLPYGALKRLEIARALASEPKLLLLDEPAAGCNSVESEEIDGLIQQIARKGTTVALVLRRAFYSRPRLCHRDRVDRFGRQRAPVARK